VHLSLSLSLSLSFLLCLRYPHFLASYIEEISEGFVFPKLAQEMSFDGLPYNRKIGHSICLEESPELHTGRTVSCKDELAIP
jgi:hypothetical protein